MKSLMHIINPDIAEVAVIKATQLLSLYDEQGNAD